MGIGGDNLGSSYVAFRARHSVAAQYPPIFSIEPTNVCNLACPMCPNSRQTSGSLGYMQWSLFTKVLDEIGPHAKVVMLYSLGEPLLHPRIVQMVEYCKKVSRAKIIISTNAIFLDESMARALLASGLDEIKLCLDANSSKTYHQMRPGGNFAMVAKNVQCFLELKGNNSKPYCVVQFIRTKINSHETEEFTQRWEGYDCEPRIVWLNTWANQIPGLARLSDDLCPNRFQKRLPCAELWLKMVINWQGKVPICCHDWSRSYVGGDVSKDTVAQIWNGPALQRFRSLHSKSKFEKIGICAPCFEWSREEEISEYF